MRGGVRVIQAVGFSENDERVGFYERRYDGGKTVVVAVNDFLDGDGVVFVHDRNHAEIKKPLESVDKVLAAVGVIDVVFCHQQLADAAPILREHLIVEIHQRALSDRRRGLLSSRIARTFFQAELFNAYADCAGRDEHDALSGIGQIAQHLREKIDYADPDDAVRHGFFHPPTQAGWVPCGHFLPSPGGPKAGGMTSMVRRRFPIMKCG